MVSNFFQRQWLSKDLLKPDLGFRTILARLIEIQIILNEPLRHVGQFAYFW